MERNGNNAAVLAGRAQTGARDVGVRAAHDRFGGVDVAACLVGMLTGLALTAILAGLVGAAIGLVGYQRGLDGAEQELSIASVAGGIVVLFLAFLVGGWASARIARYDGGLNGLLTGVAAVLLAALVSALAAVAGDKYDVLRNVDMPQWFSRDAATVGAIVSGVAAVAVMLVGGYIGGRLGGRFHERADATIAAVRAGGIGATRERIEAP